MRSTGGSVDSYIAAAPHGRREALELLRKVCCEELPGFEEAIVYGMPSYMRDGEVEVSFASQKAYVSLYVLRQAALQSNIDRLDGLSVGKGCIRFRRPEQIDPEIVRALLAATASDTGPIC